MNKIFNHIKNTIFIILGSAILAIFTYSAIAFTEPTQSPPNGNVPAPLNTGPIGQIKSGGLTVQEGITTGSISTGGITVNGAGTFASVCLGGVCYSVWPPSNFNPSGDYSAQGLRAASASTANYAASAGTANTLQGYLPTSPGGSGANQVPVTDSSGRLSNSVMSPSAAGACGWYRNSCPAGTIGGISEFETMMRSLEYIQNNFGKFRNLSHCQKVRACEVSLGGHAVRVSGESYTGVALYTDNYYDSNNNCNAASASPYYPAYIYQADYECRIDNLYFCCPQ